MRALEDQLADYGRLQEDRFGPIDPEEVTDRTIAVQRRGAVYPAFARHPLALAVAAMVVVLLLLGGFAVLSDFNEPPEPAMPLPAPMSCPHVIPEMPTDTSSWVGFQSRRYGLTICHPADWEVLSSDHDWALDTDAVDPVSTGQEGFISPAGDVRMGMWSVALDPGTATESWEVVEAWVEAYCEQTEDPSCAGFQDRAVELCNERWDCHPGLLVPFRDDVQAFFIGGKGMVVVAIWRGELDPSVARYGGARQLLEAFISTMDVCPTHRDREPWGCPRATS